ncbi:MAG TPA: hypothetical protein VH413_10320 [Verrucomicrobiae bacterium]|jgi:hypothetical protein|nr:hypothetical protein [Verrucomicrobiae bacterium]
MKPGNDSTSAKQAAPVRYNPLEVSLPGIALFAGLVVLMLVLVFPASKWMLRHFEMKAERADTTGSQVSPAIAASRANFPAPRDQLKAPEDLAIFNMREQEELNSYGWVDKRAGVVRIPISRAMDLLVEREASASTNITGPSVLQIQQRRPLETNSITGGSQ